MSSIDYKVIPLFLPFYRLEPFSETSVASAFILIPHFPLTLCFFAVRVVWFQSNSLHFGNITDNVSPGSYTGPGLLPSANMRYSAPFPTVTTLFTPCMFSGAAPHVWIDTVSLLVCCGMHGLLALIRANISMNVLTD